MGLKLRQDHERARLQGEASRVVLGFLQAWSAGDAGAAAQFVPVQQRADAERLLSSTRTQLHASTARYERLGAINSTSQPGVKYQATVEIAGLGPATWQGMIPLVRAGSSWDVAFSPTVVHPVLTTGARFSYQRDRPVRGRLLTSTGESLSVDPDLSGNLRGQVVTAKAAGASGSPAATPLPAGAVLGDDVGISGLQRALNNTLAGQAGGSMTVRSASGAVLATLLTTTMTNGLDVSTTIDLRTQRAGEAAVAGVPEAGALVAVDTETGRILAAVNHPASGLGRAITGKGPPGSTFKIITSAAALIAGVPPTTTLDCSTTASINGRSFKNAENESAGIIGWEQAFAQSCNTWFVRLQEQVPIKTLVSTAALFGFSTDPDPAVAQRNADAILPIASFGGSYPTPRDRAQAAGQAIGQDLVLASPLQMASVAAAIANGTWRQPVLVGDATVTHPLPLNVSAALRSFMAAVAGPGGTAAKAGLPPGTFGKTGTAETAVSDKDSKLTDSWFIGFRGHLAFAVEFDQAGFGADIAAPTAARFLRALPQ